MQRSKLRIENLLQQRTVIGRALLEETKTDVEIKIRIILFSVLTLYARCANIYRLKKYRGVEQLVARRAHNPEVVGSNPSPATTKVLKSQDFRTFSAFMRLESSAGFRRNRADPNRDPNADISG